VVGVKSETEVVKCKKVIITTGTFLRGMIHIGKTKYPAGRHIRNSEQVEPPSTELSKTFERYQFPLGRLTTGTPPRLDGRTINYSILQRQGSDDPIQPFSFVHEFEGFKPVHPLIDCYMTATNASTHKIIEENRHLLP
jgi:tRNA uridine 5-carboxymethylaminomethyl modification enzyme